MAAVLLFQPGITGAQEAGKMLQVKAKKHYFNLSAADGEDSLGVLSRLADQPLVYLVNQVRGVRLNSVEGEMTLKEAAEKLVENTVLYLVEDEKSGILLIKRSDRTSETVPSGEIGLTHTNELKPKENMTNDETPSKNLFARFFKSLATAIVLANTTSVHAQEDNGEGQPIYELSPFSVDDSEDSGYYSPNTLAGTRIKSNLKDIGTSIQVVTKDFLEDLQATNSTELLIYTTNTETGGITGNYSGGSIDSVLNTDQARVEPQNAQRVRGLFRADLTRNYFKTIIPFDVYNTDRVAINRGSNANLFGLGSPAGIINAQLSEANMTDHFGTLSLRLSGQDSIRASVDINHVLFDKKLAVRAAVLYDDRKYSQRPAYEKTDRQYITAKFRPLENTTFKGYFENGRIRGNRPDTISPKQNLDMWFAHGKPMFNQARGFRNPTGVFLDLDGDPSTLEEADASIVDALNWRVVGEDSNGNLLNEGQFFLGDNGMVDAPNLIQIPGAIQPLRFAPPRIFNQGVAAWSNPNQPNPDLGFIGTQGPRAAGDALDEDGVIDQHRFWSVQNKQDFFQYFNRQGFVDPDQFDFVNNMLAGVLPFQNQDFQNANLALEQTFLDNRLGFEIAWDYQEFESDHHTPVQDNASDMWVDVNLELPDGRPNPNAGRPFINGRRSKGHFLIEQDSFRATVFYKHDFAEQFEEGWGKWLGRHNITGLYANRDTENYSYSQRLVWDDEQLLRNINSNTNYSGFRAQVNPILYVGPDLRNAASMDDIEILPVGGAKLWNPGAVFPITFFDTGIEPGTQNERARDPATIIEQGSVVTKDIGVTPVTTGSQISAENVTSEAAIIQSHFLNDILVTTVGYRKDEVDLTKIQGAPEDNVNREILGKDVLIEGASSTTVSTIKEDRWSWGVVAHLPNSMLNLPFNSQFSLHYAESTNFQPEPGRVDFQNRALPSPKGTTEEKGFTLAMMDNKLHLRFNWYETALQNSTSSSAFANLSNNVVFQGADSVYRTAFGQFEDGELLFSEFNTALAETILENATPGEVELFNLEFQRDPEGRISGLTWGALTSPEDIEDVLAKGKEIEIIYSPTRNWRIAFNAAQQTTIRTNLLPVTGEELIPLREQLMATPIPGFEWVTVGEVPRGGANENFDTLDPDTQTFITQETRTFASDFEGDSNRGKVLFRTLKAAEGSVATEQREWRFNFVTNYSFEEGRFKGFNVGGAYRWQDEASIGFPLTTTVDGEAVGDIANPFFAPSEADVDLWVGYKIPLFKDLGRWRVQLNVRNVFASDRDVIPVQVQPDGSYARVRGGPQREWFLTSTFSF